MAGVLFDQLTEKRTEFTKRSQGGGIGGGDAQFPITEEGTNPARIIEALGELAKSIEKFAIHEVEPGSAGPETSSGKWVGGSSHGNEIKAIDTLQQTTYRMKRG